MRITASPEALFRYLVVSAVLARISQGTTKKVAVADVTATPLPTLDGHVRQVTRRTVYRWLARWRTAGMDGLEPTVRKAAEASRVLTDQLVGFLVDEKRSDPRASVPELIRRARLRGLVEEDEAIDRVTVWRVLRRMDVGTRRQKQPNGRDTRSFEYPHRMQMLLCDGKHFRAGKTRAKRVALFFLDDASRLGLHVVVGTAESTALFLRGLYEMIRRHGLFDRAYLDRGPGFIALDTAAVFAQLEAPLIHGTAGYPQGRGKIERFNRTALDAVLSKLNNNEDVDPDCGALELRLSHWLREIYNHASHKSHGEDVTPWQRWCADARDLRLPADDATLRGKFVLHETRKVTNDHLVSWDGEDLEVPKGLAGQQVELCHQVLDGTIHVLHEGRLVRLHPVDRHANALSRRGHTAPEETPPSTPRPSAAELAFRRDLAPLVGPDGGFSKSTSQEEES